MEGQHFDNERNRSISTVPQIYLNDKRQSVLSIETTSIISLPFNDYQDHDNISFGSIRINSIATLRVNEKPKNQSRSLVTWMDWLYSLFQKPEEKETEDIDDDIPYDESQMRIIIIGTFLAISLALVASTNLGVLLANSAHSTQIVLEYVPPEPKVLYRTPHMALLFHNGLMNVYELTASNQLELHWNFTVQKIGAGGQYFAFENNDEIQVIYGDMKKVNTVIKSKTNHFTIPNKSVLQSKRAFTGSGYFRVGNYMWVFGGYVLHKDPLHVGHGSLNSYDYKRTRLWHIKKQRWLWGPDIPCIKPLIHKGSCGLALQKNIGAIFFVNDSPFGCFKEGSIDHGNGEQNCLVALVYNFTIHQWIRQDGCFYQLDPKPLTPDAIMLRSTSYFNKNEEMRIILWFMYEALGKETQIGLLDLDSSLENIQFHSLPSTFGQQQSTTLFTSVGIVYLITATYQPSQLAIQTWNNFSMNTIQTINISQELSKSLDRKFEDAYDSNFMLSVPFTH